MSPSVRCCANCLSCISSVMCAGGGGGVGVVQVNGEIYNHEDLKKSLKQEHTFATASDCEVILHLVRPHCASRCCDTEALLV